MGTVNPTMPVWSPAIGTPTEAYWGQNVAEHVVQRFGSEESMLANWTSPPHGAVSVVTTHPPTMWQRMGSSWVQIGPAVVRGSTYNEAQTIGGPLTVEGVLTLPVAKPTVDRQAAHKKYVDDQDEFRVKRGGDTMSGSLTAPRMYVKEAPNGAQGVVNREYLNSRLQGVVADGGGTMSGMLQVGGQPSEAPGVRVSPDGWISGAVAGDNTGANLTLRRGPTADQIGKRYILFERNQAPGVKTGSIEIDSASTIAYLRNSDPRLKDRVGPILDAMRRVQELGHRAFRGRWKADEGNGREWDMLSATDIGEYADYAVRGERDAVDEHGNIESQMVDYGNLVPLLFSALSSALDRIDQLEARLT